jgi:hypothetical protein
VPGGCLVLVNRFGLKTAETSVFELWHATACSYLRPAPITRSSTRAGAPHEGCPTGRGRKVDSQLANLTA